jgi:hypothetical protein
VKRIPYTVAQLTELLAQGFEPEVQEEQVYGRPVLAAVDHELHEEWTKYLQATRRHRDPLMSVFLEARDL